MLFSGFVFAADTVTVTTHKKQDGAFVVTIAWQAAAAGTKADYVFRTSNSGAEAPIMDALINNGYYLYAVRTIPGTTAPAANYDIDIDDSNSVDIMFSALDDRSATAAEEINAPNVPKIIDDDLTIQWANVTNANCTGTIKLFFALYP
jgi:hypothetical protein